MLGGRREGTAADVLRHDVGRQIALGLTLGKTPEAAVDDGDFDALASEAFLVPGRRQRGRDLFTAHCVLDARKRRPHEIDCRSLREC